MKLADIKVGRWYETRSGFGEVIDATKRTPMVIKFLIVHPFPRGHVFVTPRDVLREVQEPKSPTAPETLKPSD